jgi:hypothetical protein
MPRSRVKKPKNPHFLQGRTERPSSCPSSFPLRVDVPPGSGVFIEARSAGPSFTGLALTGYLKAVWPDLLGAILRSGRPRGPGKAFKNVGGFAPHIMEGLPGPPGPARLQKRSQTNPARLPSGTQSTDMYFLSICMSGPAYGSCDRTHLGRPKVLAFLSWSLPWLCSRRLVICFLAPLPRAIRGEGPG